MDPSIDEFDKMDKYSSSFIPSGIKSRGAWRASFACASRACRARVLGDSVESISLPLNNHSAALHTSLS